ncbi:hypothetical protein RAZWK3B_20031 [Roseobacter sp. AzwK-3b]|uniref:DUF2061 domain-containing protein n=1 Tax=Roseobacter sp. AzwK-3b TaxID=351016 RepID=UPI00015695E2|nr:DUF2061 domain-containing protein [Roseobacter sp. AzwK-3b]EDM71677.1 hypothetical protein RAZWK3B_20031 [Roseobacter sp. AzwK-3b]
METRRRTLVKAIVWNLIGLLVMSLVGLAMTGSATIGGAMAVVNTAIGLSMYVAYERVWSRIDWGRLRG